MTFKYTPDSRAFLRSSVSCPTLRPAYSAATSECALAATFASSATSSFLLARLSGIAFSEPDSHRASTRGIQTKSGSLAPCRSTDVLRRQTRWPLRIYQSVNPLRATPSAQAEGSRETPIETCGSFHWSAHRLRSLTAAVPQSGTVRPQISTSQAIPDRLPLTVIPAKAGIQRL